MTERHIVTTPIDMFQNLGRDMEGNLVALFLRSGASTVAGSRMHNPNSLILKAEEIESRLADYASPQAHEQWIIARSRLVQAGALIAT